MAAFRLFDMGRYALFELDGKTFGKGVTGIEYKKEATKSAELNIHINVEDFEFLPDGKFDEAVKAVEELNIPTA